MPTAQQSAFTAFKLLYGRPPQQASFEQMHFFDTNSHHHHLQAKLAEMHDLVQPNLLESASRQRDHYNKHSQTRKLTVGDYIWLSIPTAKKLDPQWDDRWIITALKCSAGQYQKFVKWYTFWSNIMVLLNITVLMGLK